MPTSLHSLIALVEAPSGGTPQHLRGPALSSTITGRSPFLRATLASVLGLWAIGCSTNPSDAGIVTTSGTTTAGTTTASSTTGSTGTTGTTTAGTTSSGSTGSTTGAAPPLCCVAFGGDCSSSADAGCCDGLICSGSVCGNPTPPCAGFFETCASGAACCQSGAADSGVPQMSCSAIDNQGNNACLIGEGGQACGAGVECATPFVCIGGACAFVHNATPICAPSSASCAVGDDCSSFANGTGGSVDPCFNSGLFCNKVGVNDAGSAYIGACIQPIAVAQDSSGFGFPLSFLPCKPSDNQCGPLIGSSQNTPSTCASFWAANNGTPVCMQSCQSSSDCASIAENCVNGACVPVYCWANGAPAAAYYSTNQGSPAVSSDISVLFQPCNDIGGAPSYCLPQFDNLLGVSSALCIRVGGASSGGLGAACNGALYGNDPSSLCAPGFLCYQGTCLQWCDVDDKFISPCTGNSTCTVHQGLPLFVNPTVDRGLGVCAQPCDPYNPPSASGNGCMPLDDTSTCTAQPPVCKLTGQDTNLSPPPGLCLNGIASPIPVGTICNPVEAWPDPCVSGALCLGQADGGSYVCTQLCDLHPQHGAQPSCVSPTTCRPLACSNSNGTAACTHKGICQ
jgi:hypothetical protein